MSQTKTTQKLSNAFNALVLIIQVVLIVTRNPWPQINLIMSSTQICEGCPSQLVFEKSAWFQDITNLNLSLMGHVM